MGARDNSGSPCVAGGSSKVTGVYPPRAAREAIVGWNSTSFSVGSSFSVASLAIPLLASTGLSNRSPPEQVCILMNAVLLSILMAVVAVFFVRQLVY